MAREPHPNTFTPAAFAAPPIALAPGGPCGAPAARVATCPAQGVPHVTAASAREAASATAGGGRAATAAPPAQAAAVAAPRRASLSVEAHGEARPPRWETAQLICFTMPLLSVSA